MSVLIQDLAHRTQAQYVPGQCGCQGFVESTRSMVIKQAQQPRGGSPQITAAIGQFDEERLAARRGVVETVDATVLSCLALVIDQSLQVSRILDLLAAIPGPIVPGDHLQAVEDADSL